MIEKERKKEHNPLKPMSTNLIIFTVKEPKNLSLLRSIVLWVEAI